MRERHSVMVLFERNDINDVCSIMHSKDEPPFDKLTKEQQVEQVEKDVNALSLGLFTAIQNGAKAGILDPRKTIELIIEYAKQQHGSIGSGIIQEVPEALQHVITHGRK